MGHWPMACRTVGLVTTMNLVVLEFRTWSFWVDLLPLILLPLPSIVAALCRADLALLHWPLRARQTPYILRLLWLYRSQHNKTAVLLYQQLEESKDWLRLRHFIRPSSCQTWPLQTQYTFQDRLAALQQCSIMYAGRTSDVTESLGEFLGRLFSFARLNTFWYPPYRGFPVSVFTTGVTLHCSWPKDDRSMERCLLYWP
jgi:hypothetical protein